MFISEKKLRTNAKALPKFPVILKRPRNTFSKKQYRLRGSAMPRIGQVVFYNQKQYIVSAMDDCYYSCRQLYADYRKRNQYAMYIELIPLKQNKRMKPSLSYPKYWNKRVGEGGHIGHSVDIREISFSYGEELFYTTLCNSR